MFRHSSSGAIVESAMTSPNRHGLRVDRVRDQIIAVLGLRVLAELPRSEHGEAQVGEEPDHSCQYQPTGPQQEFQSSHTSTVSVARTGVNFAPGSGSLADPVEYVGNGCFDLVSHQFEVLLIPVVRVRNRFSVRLGVERSQ